MLSGMSVVFNSFGDGLRSVSSQRCSQGQQVVAFNRRKPLACRSLDYTGRGPAQGRCEISPVLHATSHTRRTVPIMFLIGLVRAGAQQMPDHMPADKYGRSGDQNSSR